MLTDFYIYGLAMSFKLWLEGPGNCSMGREPCSHPGCISVVRMLRGEVGWGRMVHTLHSKTIPCRDEM